MKYYRYDPDGDKFAGMMLLQEDWHLIDLQFDDEPVLGKWKPVPVEVFDDNPPIVGDFPSLSNYRSIPVMSRRAWEVLQPLIGHCCEALPIVHPSGQHYFIVHVMDTIKALDEENSKLIRNGATGRVSNIYKYCLKMHLIEGKHIFKLPLEQGNGLIVDDEFRKAVEGSGLKGLIFNDLPMANTPTSS